MKEKKKLRKKMKMEEVAVPVFSLFMRKAYFQRVCARKNEVHAL